jgi:hypothetical protein
MLQGAYSAMDGVHLLLKLETWEHVDEATVEDDYSLAGPEASQHKALGNWERIHGISHLQASENKF